MLSLRLLWLLQNNFNFKKNIVKKILLIPTLLILACSGGDDSNGYNNNNNDPTNQLFLEKYDGVMWGEHDNDSSAAFWVTFSPTGVTTFNRYDGLENCDVFTVTWGEADSFGDISTVQEENEDSMVVAVENPMSMGYTVTITVSADGYTMTLVDSDLPDETENFVRDNNATNPPEGC